MGTTYRCTFVFSQPFQGHQIMIKQAAPPLAQSLHLAWNDPSPASRAASPLARPEAPCSRFRSRARGRSSRACTSFVVSLVLSTPVQGRPFAHSFSYPIELLLSRSSLAALSQYSLSPEWNDHHMLLFIALLSIVFMCIRSQKQEHSRVEHKAIAARRAGRMVIIVIESSV